jgi:hypothetical protein
LKFGCGGLKGKVESPKCTEAAVESELKKKGKESGLKVVLKVQKVALKVLKVALESTA